MKNCHTSTVLYQRMRKRYNSLRSSISNCAFIKKRGTHCQLEDSEQCPLSLFGRTAKLSSHIMILLPAGSATTVSVQYDKARGDSESQTNIWWESSPVNSFVAKLISYCTVEAEAALLTNVFNPGTIIGNQRSCTGCGH